MKILKIVVENFYQSGNSKKWRGNVMSSRCKTESDSTSFSIEIPLRCHLIRESTMLTNLEPNDKCIRCGNYAVSLVYIIHIRFKSRLYGEHRCLLIVVRIYI